MTKSFKIFWDLQCPYSKKMWEQYRGYNNKKQQQHQNNSVAVLEHVLGVGNNNSQQQQQQQQLHRLVNSISTSSTDTGTGTPLLEPVAVPVPVDDAKYVPRTIIHRDYTNVGHAAPHQELFTVYITSYAHHPQAFAAHCGASLIDTMKGRDVMFKFFGE